MILELRQQLPLITPLGKGRAFFMIDYGSEENLLWVCFMIETGECRTFKNQDVRLEKNETMGTGSSPLALEVKP